MTPLLKLKKFWMRAKFIKDILNEVKIGDYFAQLKSDKFKDIADKYGEFKKDAKLIERILPPISMRKSEIIFLRWYNTTNHNIYDKIKTRTEFNSVSAFNGSVKKYLTKFFNENYKTSLYDLRFKDNIKVSLYIKEFKYYLVFAFKYKELRKISPYINMITILAHGFKTSEKNDLEINI